MERLPKPAYKLPAIRTTRAVILLGLFFLFLLGTVFPRQVAARFQESNPDSRSSAAYVPNQVLVQFASSVSKSEIAERLSRARVEPRASMEKIGVVVIDVPEGEFEETIEFLQNQPGVLAVEANYIATAQETVPNDPAWDLQYGLRNIRAPQGWTVSTGASWVTIAILDTGVDRSHPDLTLKTLPGYNVLSPGDEPHDDNGHGTHVAGIAAAATNNGIGIAGTSWGAQIMPVKVLNASASGTYANVASGIIWAVDNGAQVINLSLGGSAYSAILESAVEYAYNRGVVLVGASGNAGGSSVYYPARYTQVIAVGATDSSNQLGAFSNFGDGMELAAPGVSIYSTEPGGGYSYRSGTSMAAPFVSGLAAILIGMPGNYNAGQVREQIRSSALDLGNPGWDAYYGYGLIQIDAALGLIPPTSTPTGTPTLTPTFTPISTFTSTAQSSPPIEFSTFMPPSTKQSVQVTESPATIRHTANPSLPDPAGVDGTLTIPTTTTQTISATEIIDTNITMTNPTDMNDKWSMLPVLAGCFLSLGIVLFGYAIFMFKTDRRKFSKYQ